MDYFRFRAKAGDILAIETVPGARSMDTLIGLFDSAGNLLIADDDGGVGHAVAPAGPGARGRRLTRSASRRVPDFGFTGDGGDFGRYVLNINSYTRHA